MGKAICLEIDSFPVTLKPNRKVEGNKMKKLLTMTLVLGSTVAIAACSGTGMSEDGLDGPLTGAPFTEERTVGATQAPARAPVVRSAQPVFESSQIK